MTTDDKLKDNADRSGNHNKWGNNAHNPADQASGRREPVFTPFDQEDDHEEADRDTDYASAYEEELDDRDYDAPADAGLAPETAPARRDARFRHPRDEAYPADEVEEEWHEEEEYPYEDDSDDYREQREEHGHGWPLGLIAVALVAVGLLAAGGYGVIQQRSAMQDEIRQLQAALATAASPEELSAGRVAVRELEQQNQQQLAALDAAKAENRQLQNRIAGLEQQLRAAVAGAASDTRSTSTTGAGTAAQAAATSAATRPAAPQPAAPKPAAPELVAPEPGIPGAAEEAGDWFVNFGSYREKALAESWAKKLKPAAGKVVVSRGSKNGGTFYRVRVISLADRAAAEQVSRQLQQDYGLPRLWVGMDH